MRIAAIFVYLKVIDPAQPTASLALVMLQIYRPRSFYDNSHVANDFGCVYIEHVVKTYGNKTTWVD